MKLALLSTDNREPHRHYEVDRPIIPTPQEALLQGLANRKDIEIHFISCLQRSVTSPERLADNVFFHSLHVPKFGWLRTGYQGCIRAVRKKLKEIQPDIVHGQGTERDCAISAVLSGFPNVLTIHGNMQAIADIYGARCGSFYWLAGKLETFALRRTGGVFCNSAYTESCVAPRAKKTWGVPNALRLDFLNQTQVRPAAGPPILLNIGSTLAYKQQLEILNVAGGLWRQGLKFELHFVGDRALHTEYGTAFAQQLAVAERAGYARHLGKLDTAQLITALDAASALIHFPTEEAFGLVVAEALARNLKLFGAATGGVVDIASGVDGAELFPAGDFSGLENAVARWLNNGCPPPLAAAQIMRERYHPEVIARRHLEIYREVLSGK